MCGSDIELTGEAMEVIGDYYAELRSQADTNALPITVRTLETIIRLSTAAAKARLSTGAAGRRDTQLLGSWHCQTYKQSASEEHASEAGLKCHVRRGAAACTTFIPVPADSVHARQ